jgi:transcription antitermination factor NusG
MSEDPLLPKRENERWYVLYVKSRCEKKVASYCENISVNYYLPLRIKKSVYQRRYIEFTNPLFPGYIFVQFGVAQKAELFKSNRIVNILNVHNQEQLINELKQVKAVLEINPFLSSCSALKKGDRVRIIAGPFRGFEGVVKRFKGKVEVVLNVEMIGRGVRLETSMDAIEMM